MADEPTKDYPPHGGEGKGAFGAGWPDNQQVTPNFGPHRFGSTEVSPLSTDYGGVGDSSVTPSSIQGGKDFLFHPFKLVRYMKELTAKEIEDGLGGAGKKHQLHASVRCLRVYYGELWDTVSVIQTEAHGSGNHGITSQIAIPGINRTVIPDFVNESLDEVGEVRREIFRYVEWSESFEKQKGERRGQEQGDGGAYGIVLLTWHVNVDSEAEDDEGVAIPLGAITEVKLELVKEGDPPEDTPVIVLAEAGDALQRTQDNDGVYSMVIGESRDLELEEDDPAVPGQTRLVNEGKAPIDQQVYDHVYWAPTIVFGSAGYQDSEPPPFIDLNRLYTGTRPNPPQFALDPLQGWPDDRVVINGNRDLQENVP